MSRPKWPKTGDYLVITHDDGRVVHARCLIGKTHSRVFAVRRTTKLSDEGRAKPVGERSITDLVETSCYMLVPLKSVAVVTRDEVDDDAKMTTIAGDRGYYRRAADALAAGKPLPEA